MDTDNKAAAPWRGKKLKKVKTIPLDKLTPENISLIAALFFPNASQGIQYNIPPGERSLVAVIKDKED